MKISVSSIFLLNFFCFFSFCLPCFSQAILYWDNCETSGYTWRGSFSGPNTSYISGNSSVSDYPPNVPLYVSSNGSIIHQGSGNSGSGPERVTVNFPAVSLNPNIAYCLKLRMSSIGFNPAVNSGAGVDNQDYLRLNVAYNGSSTYSPEIQVNGGSDITWTYNSPATIYRTAQGSFSNYAQVIGNEYSTIVLELPVGNSQVSAEIDLSCNASGESWLIDDIQIISGCYSPLPIEMCYMDINCDFPKVDLLWNTCSETMSDYFLVQSSTDLINWQDEGKISAAGYSNSIIRYSFSCVGDITPRYYRLVQYDLDGGNEIFIFGKDYCRRSLVFSVDLNKIRIVTDDTLFLYFYDYTGKNHKTYKIEEDLEIYFEPGFYLYDLRDEKGTSIKRGKLIF